MRGARKLGASHAGLKTYSSIFSFAENTQITNTEREKAMAPVEGLNPNEEQAETAPSQDVAPDPAPTTDAPPVTDTPTAAPPAESAPDASQAAQPTDASAAPAPTTDAPATDASEQQ